MLLHGFIIILLMTTIGCIVTLLYSIVEYLHCFQYSLEMLNVDIYTYVFISLIVLPSEIMKLLGQRLTLYLWLLIH